ncbi:MAG TPA: tetratricopeptide repeat protein [Polyangia bacterium]|nr:tetratricopeptide repeat protein [Polyangia bacterium]
METADYPPVLLSQPTAQGATAGGPAAPLRMTFVDGAGVLTLERHPLGELATLQRLEVTVPDLRLPAELTAPATRFRNRRGRFRSATLSLRPAQIVRYLAGCDLAAAGLSDVAVRLDATGRLRLAARARLGGRAADFTAHIDLRRDGPRRLRLGVDELHLFGHLPVPAPIVGGALLGAALPLALSAPARAGAAARPTVRFHATIDALELALLEVFVASGWRLPDFSSAVLETIALSSEQIVLVFGEAALPTSTKAMNGAPAPTETGDARLLEADGLLARGDYLAALTCLRQSDVAATDDAHLTERTLQVLLAGATTQSEADTLAVRMLARDPSSLTARLARASVAAERDDQPTAAALFLAAAEQADAQGRVDDGVFARAAAAIHRAAADQAVMASGGSPSGSAGVPVPAPLSPSQRLAARCEELITERNFDEADRVFAERIDHAPDEPTAAVLATERARVRLLGPGANAALAVLRTIALRSAPEEALVLRADLGERQASLDDALPALEELAERARSVGDESTRHDFHERAEALRARVHGRSRTPADELERTLAANPTDPTVAEELATIYLELGDPRQRIEALGSLLRRALGLTPARRKQIYAALGETAEAIGDLDQAEQAYWRAATIEADPTLRANYLVAHARVLLARGEVQTALAELEEALGRVPDHAGALALVADVAFAQQDWPRARQAYAALESAPGAADVISREHLMLRRAELAEAAGDDEEAETCYREVAILNPRHVEARRVLAEIALRRQDLGGGALRLEEVLHLLPLDALDQLLDVRQSLGSVYVQLQDWGSARYYLELVLAQDPGRIAALEFLVGAYLQLGLPKEATAACERLARLYQEPSKRARILYRQGEILRAEIGDDAAAFEAFLKASDVDPRFAPTMVRLVEYFWREGDFQALAEAATDLTKAGALTSNPDPALGARLVLGTALAGQRAPAPGAPLRAAAWNPALGAQILAEACDHLGGQPLEALDLALSALIGWGGATVEPTLIPALAALVAADPARPGPVRALGRIADRRGQTPLARAMYGVLAFADVTDPTAERLQELGPAPTATAESLQAIGPTVHADSRGPLRATLVALATALQGFEADRAPSGGEALRPARAAGLRRLGHLLHAPPFAVTILPATASTPAPAITVVPTRPAMLMVSPDAAELPERQWGFAAAAALEDLRSGLASVAAFSPEELVSFLTGVAAALAGTPGPGEPKAKAAEHWFTETDAVAELPVGDERALLGADVQAALSSHADWLTFLRASAHTANRIGLLVCGSPLEALNALTRGDSLIAAAGSYDDQRQARRAFMRTATIHELVRYMLSEEYQQALAAPADPADR